MSSHLISIIVPTYNRQRWLRSALVELFESDLDQFECVVIDDASEDNTLEMLEELNKGVGNGRIAFFHQPSRMGAQAARNRGIREAKGDYLLFMDSDDMPAAGGIAALRTFLENRADLDYCYGRVRKVDSQLTPLNPNSEIGESFGGTDRDIAGYHWHTMGALYRRSCVDKTGQWNPELTGSQDWEYQARVKLSGAKGEFVDVLVGYWRQHDEERVGASRFRPDYVRSVMLACESIISFAVSVDRCDKALEKRIAKKLILHALEWGANGYREERRQCFSQAALTARRRFSLRLSAALLRRLPSIMDSLLWKMVSAQTH